VKAGRKRVTYKKAGVDIDKADRFIKAIRPLIETTKRAGALGDIGGFSGFFRPDLKKFKDPVLVSSTDGVGTKLMVANAIGKYDTVGIDLVAMCANDIITCGAEPLFFLDYFATGSLEPHKAISVMKGIANGCRQAGCALLGGETAEMPGLYPGGEFDLAGFCLGIADRKKIIDGRRIKPGDVAVGIASSGLHSNGFSLVRRLFPKSKIRNTFLKNELLRPTVIYAKPVLEVLKRADIKGIVNITGGGFYGNIPRILPAGVAVKIDRNSWHVPSIFGLIKTEGGTPDREMYRTFNMGIGMVLFMRQKDVYETKRVLSSFKLKSWVIGRAVKGAREVFI